MISSEAVITYKRKRRLPQLNLTYGLSSINSTPETPRIISLARFCQKTEPGQFSERQKGHDQKRMTRGKRLCTACSEPHDSGKPVRQHIREPKKEREITCLQGSEMGPITLHSHKVLQKLKCSENVSSKSKDYSPLVDTSFGKKPGSISINLYSNEASGPNCEIVCAEGNPVSESNSMDKKRSRSVCTDSSIQKGCEIACHPDSFSKTSSENNDRSHKVKSNVARTDSHPKKFSNPLITFSRRAKRQCVNGTKAPKNVINEKRCSVVEWGNCTYVSSLHQTVSQQCDSVDKSMAMIQEINTLHVPAQDAQYEIAHKEEDRSLRYSPSGCASKTKIGNCADQEQETRRHTLVGLPIAEGVQKQNSDQHLPSSHSRPDEAVREYNCLFKCRETSSTDMTSKTKQLGSPKIGAYIESSRVIPTGATKRSDAIVGFNNISERCSVAHLELSVAPGSLSPRRLALNQNVPTSAHLVAANNLLSNMLPSNDVNCAVAIERSCCKLSIDATRSEEHLYSASLSSPNHSIVFHEKTTDRARVLDLVEIPEETVQEEHYNRTLKDENQCSSTTAYGTNHELARNAKASSVLSKDASERDPSQQSLSDNILDEVVPLACVPKGTSACIDFQGRICLPETGVEKNTYKQLPTKPSLGPLQFVGLSLPMTIDSALDAVKDSPSVPSPSCSLFKSRNCIYNQQPVWQELRPPSASDENLSLARHKQPMDNIATREGLLKGGQGSLLEKFKGCESQWSEEELDLLWIGVRRHGKDNWDTMLRDPKLQFSKWRAVEDLAERWDVEQSKLLNNTPIQPLKFSKVDSSPSIFGGLLDKPETGRRYGAFGAKQHASKFPALRTETELSLGDVYTQKEESFPKWFPFHLAGPASERPLSKNDSLDIDCGHTNSVLHHMGSKHQKPIKGQRSRMYSERKRERYDMRFVMQKKAVDRSSNHGPWSGEMFGCGKNKGSLYKNLPAGLPGKGNLPHWLREVFSVPQRPIGSAVPSSVSAIAHSVSLIYNDNPIIPPFSDSCIAPLPLKDPWQVLKMSRTTGQRVLDISASIPSPVASSTDVSWVETQLDLCLSTSIPVSDDPISDLDNACNLKQTCSNPVRANELIVIDGDASSEELISDDQSGSASIYV